MATRKRATTGARAEEKSAGTVFDAGAALGAAAPVLRFAQEMRRWADNMLGVAGSAADLSLNLAKARETQPRRRQAIDQAASVLRQARETAGMTTQELGQAIDLGDPKLLEQAEKGVAGLPFEVVLRLAGVLGRHDPLSFTMKLARAYNPTLWKALDDLGVGRLVALAGRERELAMLYRANDAARDLSDADFAEVLGFTKRAFDMTVGFRTGTKPAAPPRRGRPSAD